jgi:hypothetical protein
MHGVQLDGHDAVRAPAVRPRRAAAGEQAHGGAAASLLTLQRAVGNRAVTSLLGGVHRMVQRCGPGSDCGCSPEEKAHAMAGGGEQVQRSADHDHDDLGE